MTKIENEQELLMNIADMAITVFHAESMLLRTMKVAETGEAATAADYAMLTRVFLYDAADKVNKAGKDAINSFAEGDEQRMILMGLKRFTKASPFNSKDARRQIADKLIDAGHYCF